MREALRHHPTLALALERVVADRFGGTHAFLDVARLEQARLRRPYARVAIGLKLDPDLDLVALDLADDPDPRSQETARAALARK